MVGKDNYGLFVAHKDWALLWQQKVFDMIRPILGSVLTFMFKC